MTEETTETTDTNENADRLAKLKSRADQIGITYHPSIGADKLSAKINEQLAKNDPDAQKDSEEEEETSEPTTTAPVTKAEPRKLNSKELAAKARKDAFDNATKLIRIEIACMNPNKKDWDGEIFCAGNSLVGSVKKFVPYNVVTHVPNILYKMIEERNCTVWKKKGKTKEMKQVKEFSIKVLDPLTADEIADLAKIQAASGRIED